MTCADCGRTYELDLGEVEFFDRRPALERPTRCPVCRMYKNRRNARRRRAREEGKR